METIEFRVLEQGFPTGPQLVVVPHLNGVPLTDLLRTVELPFARRQGDPSLAGSYAGLNCEEVSWPRRHYLEEPVHTDGAGGTVLMDCVCGSDGCWPLSATITVDADTVTWSGYRHGFRDWDYRELRAFTFDRAQYEEAVRATAR